MNETDNEVQDSAGSKDDLDDADENSANKDGLEDHLDIGLGDSVSVAILCPLMANHWKTLRTDTFPIPRTRLTDPKKIPSTNH